MRLALALALLGCGSSAPPATTPDPVPTPEPAPVVAVDAAPDAGIPEELATAPAWIFRYSGGDRVETWTLRMHGEQALLVVEGAQATTRYFGPATGTAPIALRLAAPNAAMSLDCKPGKRPISARCNDSKAPMLEVLDCFHPDFQEPMTFAPAPGVEFSTAKGCTGYRRLP